MSFANSCISTIEGLLQYMSSGLKQSLTDYCDLETVDDDQTITMRDGTLFTVVRVHGSIRMIGQEEFVDAYDTVNKGLKSYFNSGGHAVHVFFSVDPDSAERDIRQALAPSIATAKRLQLDLRDLFEEDIRHMAKQCANEKTFLTLITRPSALSSTDLKRDWKAKRELMMAHSLPRLHDAPNLFAAIDGLRARHSSFVQAVMGDLREARLLAEVLDVHTAVYEQRVSVDPDFTDEAWRARLPGDKISQRETRRDDFDMSGNYWPRLERQIIPRAAIPLGLKAVEVGDRIYAPMYIDLHPEEIRPFQALFTRAAETRMPWRISFLIEAGGRAILQYKSLALALFGFTNPNNKRIGAAIKAIRAAQEEENALDVKYRIDFATWAPKGERKLLDLRASRLARAVQGWGGADVKEISGDSVEGFASTCLMLRVDSVATPNCAILGDAVMQLPLYRPASPWSELGGAVLNRTIDGKLFPYQPHSPLQVGAISVKIAEPRSGKSVQANQENLSLCLSPGLVRLPLIAVIDVGKASAGLISLLEHALPVNQRHLVASIRMRTSLDFAINHGDTQLGNRWLLPHELASLINFCSLLVTPLGHHAPPDGMMGLVRMAINEAYRLFSDKQSPKRYSRNIEGGELVDAAIVECGIVVDGVTTWWEIVDQLFDAGRSHEAMLAQRFAVPLIPDIAAISREPKFKAQYSGKKMADGEPLLDAFTRMMQEAVATYPLLSKPTKFDLGEARVVSIDLEEVAKGGSQAADHQAAVCYMLARYVAAKNFYLHEDDLNLYEAKYQAYHDKRIRETRQDKKHLQFDELHRTKRIQALRDQIMVDAREGGKHGVMLTLISQSIEDFDPQMLEFATCKTVLSRQNEKNAATMKTLFGLSETALYAVKHMIRPPGPNGSTFFSLFHTKKGDCYHVLNNTMGGIKLWAFSTSNEDTYVRGVLYSRLGPPEARKVLAQLYPGGSIVDELERRKKLSNPSGLIGEGNQDDGVIAAFIEDIIVFYERSHREAA